MNLKINKQSVVPLYKQIENGIKNLIKHEELVNGYKLPPERKLAAELGVHRNTVILAYNRLIAEGFIVSSRTSPRGYFVMRNRNKTMGNMFFPLEKMIRYHFTTKEKVFSQIFDESYSREILSLGGIVMDHELELVPRMVNIFENMKDGHWFQNICATQENETERLKDNICCILKKRNMYIDKRNIQIVPETTQALSYIIDLYLQEGDCIVLEEPVIPDTINLFRNKGIKTIGVSLEEDGPNLKELELLIMEKGPKFLYIMPNFQNPTAKVMSLHKRLDLLEISYKYGIPIIEDDSLHDFNYSDKDIPTLYSLDRYKSVIYIDTFTLTFLPGTQTAFVIGPYEPIAMIGEYIKMSQVMLTNIGQYMLNEFIESGDYEEYLINLRDYYRRKRDYLIEELNKGENKSFSLHCPEGGLFVWCDLDDKINEKKLFDICREMGLLIMPGYIFYPDGYQGSGHIRLCFSKLDEKDIKKAVAILNEAIKIVLEQNEGEDNE